MLPFIFAAGAAVMATPVSVPAPPNEHDVPASRRSGIAFGVSLGGGVGGGSGYPNESEQIGDPQFYSSRRWMPGTSETLVLMGALTDYLNFGFWFESSSFRSGDVKAVGTGIGLRTEAFPLLVLYPRLDGLGLFAQFGLGSASLTIPSRPKAEGTESVIGIGTFYEWSLGHFLGGHLGLGPSLEYTAVWSQPFEEHGLIASARAVFYGGP